MVLPQGNQKDSQNGYLFVVVNMRKSYNSTIFFFNLKFHINLIFQNCLSTLKKKYNTNMFLYIHNLGVLEVWFYLEVTKNLNYCG